MSSSPHLAALQSATYSLPPFDNPKPNINPSAAHQGLHLLLLSLHYIPLSPAFARQLYITALVYLLHGLPPSIHLAEAELQSLRSAIPASLLEREDDIDININNKNNNTNDNSGPDQRKHQNIPPASSIPHRALSTQTLLLLRAIQISISYIRYFLAVLAYYDRQYRMRERLLTLAVSFVRGTWRRAVDNVDPAFLAWLGTEVVKGIEEGWKRGNENGDGVHCAA
ncbi:MAG: hypothetical protein Q9216_001354 [Gyalolechia sp. 2 TL-2023]